MLVWYLGPGGLCAGFCFGDLKVGVVVSTQPWLWLRTFAALTFSSCTLHIFHIIESPAPTYRSHSHSSAHWAATCTGCVQDVAGIHLAVSTSQRALASIPLHWSRRVIPCNLCPLEPCDRAMSNSNLHVWVAACVPWMCQRDPSSSSDTPKPHTRSPQHHTTRTACARAMHGLLIGPPCLYSNAMP